MAIDKLIPQYLNSDTDQKLVKSVEMTDNLNVRVSNDAEGTAGVIKNILGNEVVGEKTASDVYPSGDNRVIGAVSNEKNKEILFFLWNNFKNHGIYRLDLTSGKYQKLYEDSVLNFRQYSYVDCDVVVNENGHTLLYFTDNINPPMKVNVNRLISGDYPSSLYSGTDEEKLLSLTAAKARPTSAPTYSLVNNSSLGRNDIREKHFQFAYRYKYTDGEVSALSEWSTFSFASTQTKSDFLDLDNIDFYNQINVFVKNTVADVDKITVFAREVNSETFFQIAELDNNSNTNSRTVNFTNRNLGSALSLDEVNKSYDNLPQLAKTQAIVGNRLMYGNYTEGYENKEIDAELYPVYAVEENVYTITASATAGGGFPYVYALTATPTLNYEIKLDYSNLPSTIPANSIINIEFVWVTEVFNVEAYNGAPHNQLIFNFTTDAELFSNQISNSIYFQSGLKQTGKQEDWTFSIKNVVFKERFQINVDKSKSVVIADINNALSSKTFVGIVDSNRSQQWGGHVYDKSGLASGFVEANLWLEGTAAFKLQQGNLVGNVKTFNLKFAGASISVKDAEILDTGFLSASPIAVKVTASARQRVGGETNFSIYGSYPDTEKVTYSNSGIAGNCSYIAENLDGDRSFKSNASHSFGIVYFDDRGRASGVNELPPVFVEELGERAEKPIWGATFPSFGKQLGRSVIDFELKSNPPSWAKKWQIVYAGNTDIGEFVQYTAGNALLPKDEDEFVAENIYLSLNTLEGTNNSYKESSGANIEYKFNDGDRVRVIRYTDSSGDYVYPTDVDFKVLGYQKASDNTEKFLAPAGFDYQATQGYVLKIESNNESNFDFASVRNGNSFWDKDVLIEIYTPKKEAEDKVYYAIGKTYDVVNGRHMSRGSGNIRTTNRVSVYNTGYITTNKNNELFIGDKFIYQEGGVDYTLEVTTKSIDIGTNQSGEDVYYVYEFRSNPLYTPSPILNLTTTYSARSIVNASDYVSISTGDVFHRARRLITRSDTLSTEFDLSVNWDENSFDSVAGFIEDYAISDFYRSRGFLKNKPYAYIPEAKTIRRRASVTYSDPYLLDSDRLNLSSFNLSLANWKDLQISYGNITSMINRGDALTVIQENKVSQLPVGKNIIEFSNGNANITASRNVLGDASYYAGDYGTSNPESVVERFGIVYFVDSNAGRVIRLSNDGITPISENGMGSFFEDTFKNLVSVTEKVRVVGGFDPDNDEYLITIEPVYNSALVVGTTGYFIPTNASGEFIVQGITYTPNTVLWNIWGNVWNTFCGNWDDVGNGVVFVDSVFQPQSILVNNSFIGSTSTINILVTDTSYSFSAIATLDLSTGVLTLPATTCEGDNIVTQSNSPRELGFTISYKHKEGLWGSKYSFKPTMYANINNEFYSFFDTDSGIMWKHNENTTRNNFYGTQYNSEIEAVSNINPSMVKVFEALAVEGGGSWSAIVSTLDQQTSINSSDFDIREGHRYAMIPRDTLVSTGHKIYLGKVESINNDTVTFTTPINKIPFIVGDILKVGTLGLLTGTGMEISGITDRKTVQCTTTISNISVGDNIFVEHTSRVDGDPMRDVFLKIKLTSSDTDAFEVHAISVNYDRSRLHNDRVN